ncbi:unnamed protein product [Brassicogethes aeneus]|uniref:PDZ domain-containing protein n=1 Tax=Brassicogethes aeneus TaxID=1431903 RepID=A0A9P0B334_BRAAE|nr:unnamed protein product [Brassicogethes aeneus]
MATMETENFLQDIIKLQLRKPKNWNWQLSTSKSSPHIALPIIQLYDAKGKLLVQTKDNGCTQRQSWHSADKLPVKTKIRGVLVDHRDAANKNRNFEERIKSKSGSSNNVIKSSGAMLKENTCKTTANEADNRKERPYDRNAIKGDHSKRKTFRIRKSRSDILAAKDNSSSSSSCERTKSKPLQKAPSHSEVVRARAEIRRQHKRARSDDLFRRKLKCSGGGNAESLKRAESDGYRNFLAPHSKNDKSTAVKMTAEHVLFGNDARNVQVNRVKHNNKYTTRTSSAGTLIIREESFSRYRRRRSTLDGVEDAIKGKPDSLSSPTRPPPTERLSTSPTPDSRWFMRRNKNRYVEGGDDTELAKPDQTTSPPVRSLKNGFRCYVEENGDYTVQEPVTPGESRKGSCIASELEWSGVERELDKRRQRRKMVMEQKDNVASVKGYLEKGSSSGVGHQSSNNNNVADAKRAAGKEGSVEGGGGSVRLARRLSSNDNAKMGANVSRHSSKGLSGRRSQSSGSIYSGKSGSGRNQEGKVCGSLPSYLDENNDNGTNNNHADCNRPPLDEDDRIPRLGDGGAQLHWKFTDHQTVLCDQGYGSERSPEEEFPPPLPDHQNQCHQHLEPHACYPFITPDSTFGVKLAKGSRGLGLSVTGGVDSTGAWPGLIRIKRLFPHQPASTCGLLYVGDLLIEANGVTLTGLTNYEALEVLRTASNQVELKVCRPPPDVLNCVSPISEIPPPPPRREAPNSLHLPPTAYSSPEDDYYQGEFEVQLTKVQGSLGFTLRKEDDSALGHYVRALVREPALTDGRIRAGDKIIAVNDVEISPMSHEQAVQYLRQCGEVVSLRLYRDCAQTPVAALSPTETTPTTSFSRKANLRQEAVDMLNDIAVRKLIPGNQQDPYRRSLSPTDASPRRLRRNPHPSDASRVADPSDAPHHQSIEEQFHEGLLHGCFDEDDCPSLFIVDSDGEGDKPDRPSSLDLYNPNQTPVAARKPRFNFSLAHNQYELNNLDPEVLDAPNLAYNLGAADEAAGAEVECPREPASMPHIALDTSAFSYKNPAYQTAHPHCDDRVGKQAAASKDDNGAVRKWKGVPLDGEHRGTVRRKKMPEEYQVLAIELNRGWNSRLGFSLQGAAGVTYVSAVHADSVAARDGRIKPGDRIIKVNDESVENMTTNEIIDLLRIVRGPVCIVISRVKSNEDCQNRNAEN